MAFPAGAVAVAAALIALGPLRLAGEDPPAGPLILGFGVAFLGLLDDLLDAPPRGLRGHGGALRRGELSTGILKAIGTLALAAYVLQDALGVGVVVLAAHVFNLLDQRPGRSVKAFVLLGAGLLIGRADLEPLRGIGLFAGPLLVLGVYDLRERAMLGDTGSNLLGALAGLWIVETLGTTGEGIALAVLAGLTIFGEFRSISGIVDRFGPLRSLDWLGRKR